MKAVPFLSKMVPISYLESSSLTAHAGLTRQALVKGNEDAGYEGEMVHKRVKSWTSCKADSPRV